MFTMQFPSPDAPSSIHWPFINDYCRHYHMHVFEANGWEEDEMHEFDFETVGPTLREFMAMLEYCAKNGNTYKAIPYWQPGIDALNLGAVTPLQRPK